MELRFPVDQVVGVVSWAGSFSAARGPVLAQGVVPVPDDVDVELEVRSFTDVAPMGHGSWSLIGDAVPVDLAFLDELPPDAISAVNLGGVVAAMVPSLARLAPGLRRLVLADTALDDAALNTVARLGGLVSLQTWGNRFTDEGVEVLRALQSLEFLFLEEATLTAAAFSFAGALPNLVTLGCQDASLTSEEFKELQRNLPGVEVFR